MKKNKFKKIILTVFFQYLGGALLVFLFLLYQGSFELLSLVNAFQVSGAILFILGWFVFVNHHGVFDIVVHGVQAFFKSLVGRRMEKTLFDRRMERKKMPAYLFISFWINGIILIAVGYSLYYLLYI